MVDRGSFRFIVNCNRPNLTTDEYQLANAYKEPLTVILYHHSLIQRYGSRLWTLGSRRLPYAFARLRVMSC